MSADDSDSAEGETQLAISIYERGGGRERLDDLEERLANLPYQAACHVKSFVNEIDRLAIRASLEIDGVDLVTADSLTLATFRHNLHWIYDELEPERRGLLIWGKSFQGYDLSVELAQDLEFHLFSDHPYRGPVSPDLLCHVVELLLLDILEAASWLLRDETVEP